MATATAKVDYARFVKEFMAIKKKGGTGADLASKLGWLDGNGEPDKGKVSQVRQYVNTKMPPSKMLPSLARVTNGSGEDWGAIAELVPNVED